MIEFSVLDPSSSRRFIDYLSIKLINKKYINITNQWKNIPFKRDQLI